MKKILLMVLVGILLVANPCQGADQDFKGTINGNTITAGTGIITMSAGKTLTVSESATIDEAVALSSKPTVSSGTFTGTLTGCTTSPTVTIRYVKTGNVVTLTFNAAISGTSNSIDKTITGMPAALFPSIGVQVYTGISDNGAAYTISGGVIGTNGVITIYKDISGNNWTASGTAVINGFSISYVI